MNRKERRAARSRKAVFVALGWLQERDPNYGLRVDCYLCGTTHAAFGLAIIQHGETTTPVPLCDPCLANEDTDSRIVRKYFATPDLKITDGGEVSTEQFDALADKQDRTEH